MQSKTLQFLLFSSVLLLPIFIWFRLNRHANPETVIDNLHDRYDDITFISIDYHPGKNRLLGMDRDVYTGLFHVSHEEHKKRYQFTADAYTGEIMEATVL